MEWYIVKKLDDSPIINISPDIRKEIEDNNENDYIRCVDVIHRMFHYDDDLTWEFVEAQLRKEDPQLANVTPAAENCRMLFIAVHNIVM